MNEQQILHRIRKAKKELVKVEKLKCTCTGFYLQYEGRCDCERGMKIRDIETKITNLINKI